MTKNKALWLAAFTAWPFLFIGFSWLFDLLGLFSSTSSQPPVSFIIFILLLSLTALEVWGLLIFYLVFLLTRPQISRDLKVVWAALLVIGHVFIVPLFWYLLVWKPRGYPPLPAAAKFSLLIFSPLLLILLLPFAMLFPMSLLTTILAGASNKLDQFTAEAIGWVWVISPVVGSILIFKIGKLCHRWFLQIHSSRRAWGLIWAVFTLFSLPVLWYGTFIARGMIPSDASPITPRALTGTALIMSLIAQPFIIAWLALLRRNVRTRVSNLDQDNPDQLRQSINS